MTTSSLSDERERTMCVVFAVGDERTAIRASDVQKVTPPPQLSRLPLLPAALLGVTQHRGRVVTVVDAGVVLGGVASRSGPEQRLLILERPVRHLALLVDAVFGIEALRWPKDLSQLQRGRALPLVDVAAVTAFVNDLDLD